MEIVTASLLSESIATMLDEAILGPEGPGSWFTDHGRESGFLGSIETLSAEEASRPVTPGDRISVASHVGHLRYALGLALRAMRGENPYSDADWEGSWAADAVDESTWRAMIEDLKAVAADLRTAIADPEVWTSSMRVTGMIGNVAHAAWHLGAVRQALGLVRAPAIREEEFGC